MTCDTLLNDETGSLLVYRKWCANSQWWMQTLVDELGWQQSRVKVYGREHPIPRLEAWCGARGIEYRYSGQALVATGWPEVLRPLVDAVCRETGEPFNAMLANWYRTGDDRMGWHADNEPELGVNPVVASLSLGANRDFRLRLNADHGQTIKVALGEGDLLIMAGALQHHWQHSVPKRARAEDRISLTFRTVKT